MFKKNMIKEFKIKDILNAVETISKKEKETKMKKEDNNNEFLPNNSQVKSSKSDILVLNEMIE
tara:strand:- start:335 stop:523 length:189 start_codon:yes stop_codon:yes gene_type:complete